VQTDSIWYLVEETHNGRKEKKKKKKEKALSSTRRREASERCKLAIIFTHSLGQLTISIHRAMVRAGGMSWKTFSAQTGHERPQNKPTERTLDKRHWPVTTAFFFAGTTEVEKSVDLLFPLISDRISCGVLLVAPRWFYLER